MIYIDISGKNYLIGMPWHEVVLKPDDDKKSIQDRLSETLSPIHNFGLITKSLSDDVVSAGEFQLEFSGLRLPQIYSLGYTAAKKIKNGVYINSFSLNELMSKVKKDVRLPLPQFIEEMGEKDKFYWACAVQDGVVVSSGEFTGTSEDVVAFISDQISHLQDFKLFAGNEECLRLVNSFGVTPQNLSIETLVEDCERDCQIKRIKGFEKSYLIVGALVFSIISIGGYQYYQNMQDRESRLAELQRQAMTVTQSPQETERLRIEKLKKSFIQKLNQEALGTTQVIDYQNAKETINHVIDNQPFGWSLETINCFSKGFCSISYQNVDSHSPVKSFISSVGRNPAEVRFSSDGEKVAFTVPIKTVSLGSSITEETLPGFFKGLSGVPESIELISRSQINSSLSDGFKWATSQEFEHKTDVEAFPGLPYSFYSMSLSVASNDYYEMDTIHNSYSNFDGLNLSRIEVKNSNDKSILWALEYGYKSLITNK